MRKRNLIIAISGVLVIAAVMGVVLYRANTGNTPVGVPSGYTVSGTVSYNGTQPPGRVYIEVIDSNGGYSGLGTSIASPGSYAIRNVPTGTYFLRAWIDNSDPQTGAPNALSPGGNIPVNINDGNVSGQNITVVDPSPAPTPAPPTSVGVAPGNGSVLIQWNPPQDANGNVLAQYYNVYYDTSSSVSPQTGIKKTVQAGNNLFINGLTDGTTYYFTVTAVLGGVESPASTPVASANIGAATGSNTVSGNISFPITATGPMYVGVSGRNGSFFQRIDKPASPQPYRISGVPNGTYVLYAILDMNNNGIIDTGDLNKTNNNPSGGNTIVSIAGDLAAVDQTLLDSNVLAQVVTIHFGQASLPGSDVYSLEFEVGGNLKLPVNVALVSGPDSLFPTDISGIYNYYHLFQTADVKPKAGDSYVFAVNYSDGTSEKVTVSVTAVLDSFAQNLSAGGTNRNIPTFSWSAPASPPPEYTYLIQLGQRNIGREWTYPQTGNGMPSSQTSVLYNVDGSASLTSLQSGTTYDWLIYVIDPKGNQAICDATYTP